MKYEYGVEYPTNGKKPDLPDDVIVNVKSEKGWTIIKQTSQVKDYVWSRVNSFCVNDSRYKPKQPAYASRDEMAKHSIIGDMQLDNSWFDRGELPPVGAEIEVVADGEDVSRIHVVWSGDDVVFGWDMGAPFIYAHFSAKAYKFRPINTEREKFIDACIASLSEFKSANQVFGELYDAGFRAPEAK